MTLQEQVTELLDTLDIPERKLIDLLTAGSMNMVLQLKTSKKAELRDWIYEYLPAQMQILDIKGDISKKAITFMMLLGLCALSDGTEILKLCIRYYGVSDEDIAEYFKDDKLNLNNLSNFSKN